MSSRYFIYSTLSTDVLYTDWHTSGNDLPVAENKVLIRGGAGVVERKNLVTPLGVVTEVDEAQLMLLKKNLTFQQHEKNGYIKIQEQKVDPEVAAADMAQRDGSAPKVPEDFTVDGDGPQPSEGPKGKKNKG